MGWQQASGRADITPPKRSLPIGGFGGGTQHLHADEGVKPWHTQV
jgi:hypothetical protein